MNSDNMKLSKSSVNSFLQCRRAFKYRYIDKLPDKANDYMKLGIDVHSVAEHFVKDGGISSNNYRKKLQEIAEKIDSDYDLDIHLDNLAVFFEEVFHDPNMKYEVFCAEEYLYDEKHNLSGLCDLVVRDENNDLVIIDYKTGKPGSIKKYRLELVYYKMLLESKYPNVDVISAGIFFTKNGKARFLNFVETQDKGAYCTEKDYKAAESLLDFIREEVKNNRLEPQRQFLCKYCAYEDRCKEEGGF